MINIGIVGSEAAKFTPETELIAREGIRNLLDRYDRVISGACHLGGIDIWAVEEAIKKNIPYIEYPPHVRNWEGYKRRNIQIAETSNVVVCITIKELPPGYRVKGFEKYCYHCKTDQHIKSGGCWTTKYARSLGKNAFTAVIADGKIILAV